MLKNVKRNKLNVNFQRLKLKFNFPMNNFSQGIDKTNFIYQQCQLYKANIKIYSNQINDK